MKRMTLSQAKAKFGECVRLVKRGESIVILDRTRPVAKIVRIEETDKNVNDVLQELEDAGLITRAVTSAGRDFFKHRKLLESKRSVVSALLDERRENNR